jgi:hypothetical protein
MKRVSLLLYLAILVASLALGYLTWVREPKKQGDKVPILSCEKGDILKLTYEDKEQTVTFSQKKNAYSGESSWWVEVAKLPASSVGKEADVPEGGNPEEPAPKEPDSQEGSSSEEAPPAIEVFKASNRLQDGMDKFCPWMALRSLGQLGEAKRAEFGLTGAGESLIIELASGPRTFRLGETTFGPKDRYVADSKTGEVFVVAGQDLRDLGRSKSRFMERALHAFKMKDVSQVRLRAGQRERELVQQVSEEGKEQGWADSRSPEELEVLYRNWIRRLSTLRATDYIGTPDDREGSGCVAPAGAAQELSVTYFGPSKEIGFLNVYKGEGTDEKGDTMYYACSEHSEVVVKVPKTQAENLLKDLEDVLSN